MSIDPALVEKKRRLAQLELTAARYGIDCPPHVTIEIEDLRREIAGAHRGAPERPDHGPTTVLAAFAQPRGLTPTEWEREARELRAILTPFAQSYRLLERSNLTVEELHEALLNLRPTLLHFQGHGTSAGLVLMDSQGDPYNVAWPALMRTLAACESLTCVVLNACDSQVHRQIGSQRFHLITTPGTVSAEATRIFTSGFYRALIAGRNVPQAFHDGCNLLDLKGIAQAEWPVLTEARAA